MLRCTGCGYLGSKVLEKGPRDGGEEVHVGWGVKALREIACNSLNVSLIGLDKVDNGDIGDGVSLGVDIPSVKFRVSPEFNKGVRRAPYK